MMGVVAPPFIVIESRRHGNLKESQTSKIKKQNDRANFKNVVRGFSLVHDPEGSHYKISMKLIVTSRKAKIKKRKVFAF